MGEAAAARGVVSVGKRRPNRDGSIYQAKDRGWRAYLTIDGCRRYFFGRTQAEVLKKLHKALRAICTLSCTPPSRRLKRWALCLVTSPT